ncbi:hypothetical protein HMP09_2329 [Sphingomonas sp. HMP9]|nr:hypothetical protein HMP09_2329 [Sphingomonas sp. HMP9]
MRNAEASYSRKRLRSIADEWREAYGDLEQPLNVLRDLDVRFSAKDVSERVLESLCINLMAGDIIAAHGRFVSECDLITRGGHYNNLRKTFLEILYIIGAIGVRFRKGGLYEWSFRNEPLLDYGALNDDTTFAIHPMLLRALNKRADPTSLV